jgi:hypothetical protein
MTAPAGGPPGEDTDVLALVRNGTLAGQWTLVPAESSAEFANRHFWNTITASSPESPTASANCGRNR